MKNTFDFELVNPAKNIGGDRYKTIIEKKDWTVYFPQKLSRLNNKPVQNITMIVHTGMSEEKPNGIS